jgi:hypothetical protein
MLHSKTKFSDSFLLCSLWRVDLIIFCVQQMRGRWLGIIHLFLFVNTLMCIVIIERFIWEAWAEMQTNPKPDFFENWNIENPNPKWQIFKPTNRTGPLFCSGFTPLCLGVCLNLKLLSNLCLLSLKWLVKIYSNWKISDSKIFPPKMSSFL